MLAEKIKLNQGGRIILPSKMRKALSMEVGDELFIKVENEGLKIFNLQHAVKEAQKLMSKYNRKKICLSDKIIEDRRNEA